MTTATTIRSSPFSKMLGFAAPFLNFIPGVGPILSTLASIGSSALGGDYAGAIMGAAGGFSSGGAFRRTSGAGPSVDASAFTTQFGAPPPPVDGKRATGGPVKRGRTYIVGEHRAEVFEPDEDGFIHRSTDAFERSRGGGSQGGGGGAARAGSVGALIQKLMERMESMSPGDVLTLGAKSNPGAITDGFMRGASRDPKVTEWMSRRVQPANG
ncbi:MAG TPA: hypothetical protein VGB98_02480 [Pyrinomonadaceae bacterium]|jgi:hypothetical protein